MNKPYLLISYHIPNVFKYLENKYTGLCTHGD